MEAKQGLHDHPHGFGTLLVPHPPIKPAESKLPPIQGHTKLPPIRKYPLIEQKGYYSELITTAAKPRLQVATVYHLWHTFRLQLAIYIVF